MGSREERTIMAQEAVVRAHLVVMVVMVMVVVRAHQRAAAREEK